METLKATRALVYATRRLLPGDSFQAPARDARVLVAVRKAVRIRPPVVVPPPPPALAAAIDENYGDEDLKAARAEFAAVVGRPAYHGWDAERIRERIETFKAG